MNMPKIVKHREREDSEMGYSITKLGGKDDGEEFRMVIAEFDDGTTKRLFASNVRDGYFKEVLVPWDFEHEKILS